MPSCCKRTSFGQLLKRLGMDKRIRWIWPLIWAFPLLADAQTQAGPQIICYDGKAIIFPASWLGKPTRAKATAADTHQYSSDSLALQNALNMYPAWLLQKSLDHIYLVGTLQFNRQFFTGTNSTNDVYIASANNHDIAKTFHHELSSILLRQHGHEQLEMQWRQLSPALRGGSSAAAVKQGLYATEFDSVLCAQGYLSPYSLSNWENDFNMYAENIFAGGKAFWQWVGRYPLVKQKAQLVIKFYNSIWGGYTETFFRAAL